MPDNLDLAQGRIMKPRSGHHRNLPDMIQGVNVCRADTPLVSWCCPGWFKKALCTFTDGRSTAWRVFGATRYFGLSRILHCGDLALEG